MAGTDARSLIGGIRTIGIPVADQDRAVAFYMDKLGFEKRMDVGFGPGQRWVEVAPPGSSTSIALLAVPAAGAGIDTQIRLTAEDAEAVHRVLVASGVDADQEILRVPVPMFAFRDLDGNRLVIVEQPAGSKG